MYKQKYFSDRNFREKLIRTIREANEEVGRTVYKYAFGLYYEGMPQEITVIGENYEAIEHLNQKLWG